MTEGSGGKDQIGGPKDSDPVKMICILMPYLDLLKMDMDLHLELFCSKKDLELYFILDQI